MGGFYVLCLLLWNDFPTGTIKCCAPGFVDSFYIALFSALEQSLRSHVILHVILHIARFLLLLLLLLLLCLFVCCLFVFNIHRSGVLTALVWLVPRETAAISARSVYTTQPCTVSLHAKPCGDTNSGIPRLSAERTCVFVSAALHHQ